MNSLVIYDSNYGNTQKVAEAIAEGLQSKAVNISNVKQEQLDKYDLLVMGTPINGWMPTKEMQDFISGIDVGQLSDVSVATFDTRVKLFIHGDAMQKLAKSLKNIGAKRVVDTMPFYVGGKKEVPVLLEGELEKARDWGGSLLRSSR